MNAPIVTLTTDWGDSDHYAAMVKGRLCSSIPDVRIVDLSHSQDWNSIAVASKLIQYGCMSFPAGTVHIIDFCEDLQMIAKAKKPYRPVPLLAECKGQFFLCCNRKLLEVSLDAECDSLVSLPLSADTPSDTFVAWSLFCDVAAKLVNGVPPSELGVSAAPLMRREFLRAQFDGTIVSSRPDSIDHYGNVTLNLKYSDFVKYRAGRRFRMELEFQAGSLKADIDLEDAVLKGSVMKCPTVTEVMLHYSEVRQGGLALTVSGTGYMQLAINQGSVASLMGVNYATVCRFIFSDF